MNPQSNLKRSFSQTSTTSSRSSQSKRLPKLSSIFSSKIFRSKSPAPIDISKSHNHSQIHNNSNISYLPQGYTSTSPTEMFPMSLPQSPKPDYDAKYVPAVTQKSSSDHKRYSGTINHYGRHSNDWLFGGFSLRESVRDGLGKLRNSDKEG